MLVCQQSALAGVFLRAPHAISIVVAILFSPLSLNAASLICMQSVLKAAEGVFICLSEIGRGRIPGWFSSVCAYVSEKEKGCVCVCV